MFKIVMKKLIQSVNKLKEHNDNNNTNNKISYVKLDIRDENNIEYAIQDVMKQWKDRYIDK